ncbi:MAG: glycosyltransferase family 2 protein [Gammaproteobacteria bacterium]|nr:glycosyltransferase family 2 protein [Gammaproteobacteria bacterium]
MYLSVHVKFVLALICATAWTLLSLWLAHNWFANLSSHVGFAFAVFLIGGIAIVPGFMNSFLLCSLLLDRRPQRKPLQHYLPLSILIAAYNEAPSIEETLKSIAEQNYPGELQVIVINDGSTDRTADIVRHNLARYPWLALVDIAQNGGKARALNRGLQDVKHGLVLTVDADSYLYRDALHSIVERYMEDPATTRAVAGTVLVRNSRSSWIAQAQEWDYFHGIAAIKRTQSLFQGTLVAQGAFSLYDRATLESIGGWPECVGEDIVVTWAILKAGYRVGHCEDACLFTNAPATLKQFFGQRRRWARGMVEAFKHHPGVLLKPQLPTFFIYWNLLFPLMDLAFTIGFLPGLVLALFGHFWIVGPMTLSLIPLGLAMNFLMFNVEVRMFRHHDLKVRKNPFGFMIYVFCYSVLLQPICLIGYLSELFSLRKSWGTK